MILARRVFEVQVAQPSEDPFVRRGALKLEEYVARRAVVRGAVSVQSSCVDTHTPDDNVWRLVSIDAHKVRCLGHPWLLLVRHPGQNVVQYWIVCDLQQRRWPQPHLEHRGRLVRFALEYEALRSQNNLRDHAKVLVNLVPHRLLAERAGQDECDHVAVLGRVVDELERQRALCAKRGVANCQTQTFPREPNMPAKKVHGR